MADASNVHFVYGLSVYLAGILFRLSWIDVKTLRLPDIFTLPLIILGLGLSWVMPEPGFQPRVIGAAAGFLSLALIGELYFRRTGVEGLGLGDAKLFAASGAWLGWQALPQVLLIASLTGLFYVGLFRRGKRETAIAFGPLLALGFMACWITQMVPASAWIFRAP